MNPACPNCAGPATTVIPEHDGSSRGVCDPCRCEWWIRSDAAPDRNVLVVHDPAPQSGMALGMATDPPACANNSCDCPYDPRNLAGATHV